MIYHVYFTLVHFLAIWSNLAVLFFYLLGRMVKNSAVRFSIYSAIWIRLYGQVRNKVLDLQLEYFPCPETNHDIFTFTVPTSGITGHKVLKHLKPVKLLTMN